MLAWGDTEDLDASCPLSERVRVGKELEGESWGVGANGWVEEA